MNDERYIELSKISNAILLGEITGYRQVQSANHTSRVKAKQLTDKEKLLCRTWCNEQFSHLNLNVSTAVLDLYIK